MHKRGIKEFNKYYVGINSLEELATKEDRVCVMNITGNESRGVTPISHAFSGGNVVFGTAPGRTGQILKTAIGDIPVYNNITEGIKAGHKFNVAVIYMPPNGVRDAVVEAIRNNKDDLKKIIILTEKVSVKDARIIRALGQMHGVDIFGSNCLGLADSHNKVRLGGALGGTNPEESLRPGSVAIYSNSGSFTTTIAGYLLTDGWGTTASVSSGKDVYIHYSAKEFIHAFNNDKRTKAAVMYIEPGGYYEYAITPQKPVIACVVGRWKSRLTKAVGHAGSLAGAGDDALSKEKWFMECLSVDGLYSPENPICTSKGAVVTNISYIPEAMTKVMELNGIKPDFEPQGDLSRKAWFGNSQGLDLPKELDVPIVRAIEPYDEQIDYVNKQIGTSFPRQSLKDTSGASKMDPVSQVTTLHNISILDVSKHNFEDNVLMSITKLYPENDKERKLINVALNTHVYLEDSIELRAYEQSLENGNTPNTAILSTLALVGQKKIIKAQKLVEQLINSFKLTGLEDPLNYDAEILNKAQSLKDTSVLNEEEADHLSVLIPIMEKALEDANSIFYKFVKGIAQKEGKKLTRELLLGIITLTLGWRALVLKKLSITSLINLPWYFKIYATLVGVSAGEKGHRNKAFVGVDIKELAKDYTFGQTTFMAMSHKKPLDEELFTFNVLMGLVISNGPGTISGQGAKGAVSSDGPEDPKRVQINKAFCGFLTHTGFAHGGNGYEAMNFLIGQFNKTNLEDPGNRDHNINIKKLAKDYALSYKGYKKNQKELGNISYEKVPCINHPVFKGKSVNYDPREVFVRELFEAKGTYNIFLDFYHELVNALYKNGVSKEVYCVNIDAVIAVILLKIFWNEFKAGEVNERQLENSAFTAFLYGRMLGSGAEIDDHINRGRNMDTRTPASRCAFVN